jgi:hypothetical protein
LDQEQEQEFVTRRRRDEAALLEWHRGNVALLPAFVKAHSLMDRGYIMRAEQQNLQRALGLQKACGDFADAARAMHESHRAEEEEMRAAPEAGAANADPAAPGAKED